MCHETHITSMQLADLAFDTALDRFVRRSCAARLDGAGEHDGAYLYDSLAVAAALRPEVLTPERALVRGETPVHPGRHEHRLAAGARLGLEAPRTAGQPAGGHGRRR